MKKIVLGLVLALSPVAAGQAFAANCADGNVSITSVPHPQTATVSFDQFIAGVGDPASCALSVTGRSAAGRHHRRLFGRLSRLPARGHAGQDLGQQ